MVHDSTLCKPIEGPFDIPLVQEIVCGGLRLLHWIADILTTVTFLPG